MNEISREEGKVFINFQRWSSRFCRPFISDQLGELSLYNDSQPDETPLTVICFVCFSNFKFLKFICFCYNGHTILGIVNALFGAYKVRITRCNLSDIILLLCFIRFKGVIQ